MLVNMNETLLRDLYDILQRVFDPKPMNPKPILLILDQYIYSNPLFNETNPDLTNYIAELELGITVSFFLPSSDFRIAPKKYIRIDGKTFSTNHLWILFTSMILLTASSPILKGFINGLKIQS
jgi:hypothetical protein